jgi:hypothetical protein
MELKLTSSLQGGKTLKNTPNNKIINNIFNTKITI